MNAPTSTTNLTSVQALPLTTIAPSQTAVQAMRRARFSPEGLQELADSFRENDVLQPILVRPTGPQARAEYEIVAGERRWRAAEIAGLTHIPAVIREMTDEQALEAQVVENLQRDELLPLEEASAYRELMNLKGIAAEDVGDLVGKSRSWVYGRLKLLGLPEEARNALQAGELDASRALLVARIADPKRQAKALELATKKDWNGVDYRLSYRALRQELERTGATASLAVAVFDQSDETYSRALTKRQRIDLPACGACPNRDGDVCTDVPCYEVKTEQHGERLVLQAQNEGRTVLIGEAAKAIAPDQYRLVGYFDLADDCDHDDQDEDRPPRTYAELLAGATFETTLLQDPKTKRIRQLVDIDTAAAILAEKHRIELPAWMLPSSRRAMELENQQTQEENEAKRRKEQEEHDRELERRQRVFRAIAETKHGGLAREELVELAARLVRDNMDIEESLALVYDPIPEPGQLKDADLAKFIRLGLVADIVLSTYTPPGALNAMAKRLDIDVARVRAGKPEKTTKPAAAKKAAPAKKAKAPTKGKKK
jgi:ParB/RepB/Spo0J family partition protein